MGRDYLSELKTMTPKEMQALSGELREKIVSAVSKNGGHLASNLGMVEATIALHHVFDSPHDKIIFDVGHQSYAHKILTGREDEFDTLRTFGGVSGFPSRRESEHDVLTEGHSGTSVSSAIGIATANKMQGNDGYAIAVIGDGSLTNGMVYEALNNCNDKDLRLIIIVNDNEMSISKNVGGLPKYLSNIRISRSYFRFKRGAKRGIGILPLLGKPFVKLFALMKNAFRRLFLKSTMFEDLGLNYIGPVDGNNIKKLVTVLTEAKKREMPTVIHIRTKKGLGYLPAEKEPSRYHGVCPFDKDVGVISEPRESYSSFVGATLTEMADEDEKICAITAAMADGTGLNIFQEKHPDRFFDVGIAEEHALTFGAGLSVSGLKPVVALYSTFAQRVYDQLLHDVSLQNLPLTLLLDRCGLVEGDGITHQGIFDYPIFTAVPNAKIYSPETYEELKNVLSVSISSDTLDVIRYPKGAYSEYECACEMIYDSEACLAYSKNISEAKKVIITYGRMTRIANEVIKGLDSDTALIKLVRIFPFDKEKLKSLTNGKELVYIIDEGYVNGGVGEKISAILSHQRVHVHAIEGFVEHGLLSDLYSACKFTRDDIISAIKNLK
ncbi:MAG: 1-deoxy-D-xylulose-5-phosphate synthase [Clostridia bacterium]|nr:1-deoxy-D-xylulose-5-phosphate synthase [Clostridia bacterium]